MKRIEARNDYEDEMLELEKKRIAGGINATEYFEARSIADMRKSVALRELEKEQRRRDRIESDIEAIEREIAAAGGV